MKIFGLLNPLPNTTCVALSLGWLILCVIDLQELSAEELRFNRDIRPILSDNCFACHGFDAKQRKGGLRLDIAEGAYGIGDSGEVAIKPGDLEASEVWKRIAVAEGDSKMPPAESHKSLDGKQVELLKKWIEQGAPYESHWSLTPIARPEIPDLALNSPNDFGPIDRFISARLNREGLELSAEADRETLLRRASLDLIGLNPELDEIDDYLTDTSPNAFERQLDRLLASPRFGEKQVVSWLDVSRYGDTNGYLHDIMRSGWPWRDWVIQSFNDDKNFSEFIVEQVAGDLLPEATPEQVLATAFCRNHLITTEGGTIAAEFLNEYAADRVQTFGTAFLGVSFSCCRCHDHKFDPFTQDDFYSLQAYFNSITEKHSENNPAIAYPPLIEIGSPLIPDSPKASVMVMQEAAETTKTFVLNRGQYDQPIAERPVGRRTPLALPAMSDDLPQNRLGLARWLIADENPLVARVVVNRFWQQIFGTGIVSTVDDLGVQGEYPVHPELLDYLASEFRGSQSLNASGRSTSEWSMKRLYREILTSRTYRQQSRVKPEAKQKDPNNRLLAYFPRQRLSAEEIRDQAIFVSGMMANSMGGAPVNPYQPEGLWEERANEGSNTRVFKRSDGEALYRRSLYTFWKRTCPPPTMVLFDAPDRTLCAAKRVPTNTPLQALAALNDEQFLESARLLATRTLSEQVETDARIKSLFRRVTGRTPTEEDLQVLRSGLASLLQRYQTNPDDAARLLDQGDQPLPAEVNKPELAAWMLLANAVLNLDESVVRD